MSSQPSIKNVVTMYDGARVPSPQDIVNGVLPTAVAVAGTGAGEGGSVSVPAPAVGPNPEEEEVPEEEPSPEPVLVKKAHREILDHDRKRRVELKCMELQEMMEEQGYSEEEIRQKVCTFRQMLMEKEGVITRERAHTDPTMKRNSSSSPSPRPKKRKKKKRAVRRSRFDSSSPSRREKKKKSGKKHKRDRSTSGHRRKRRYRSGSPKNKLKDKTRKRSPLESPSRTSQRRGSCCSSHSASLSSTGHSPSKSLGRPNSKHKTEGHKACVSPSPSPSPGPDGPVTWHNGHHHRDRGFNGKAGRLNHSHAVEEDKEQEKLRMLTAVSPGAQSTTILPQLRGGENKAHTALYRAPGSTAAQAGEALHGEDRQTTDLGSSGRWGGHRVQGKRFHSPTHSSDSAHSQHNLHPHREKSSHQKKTKRSHSSKRHRRGGRGQAHHQRLSASPGRHHHASGSGTKKSESRGRGGGGVGVRQRSSSWSSGRSSSCSASRERGPSKAKSLHVHARQNNSSFSAKDRDSPHHSDADRAHRRSRSYSPIRKRRRDSPSFMEARRITSARKRPIPYYRPSPSSSSSMSSPSHSGRSRSRSYSCSHSRTRSHSRSRSPRSHSRSRSPRSHSNYSRSSYESPGF
ncbi:serine/arginine repetitive matrix protein 3-like isoform X2 [Oncorhynchus keta]|uniref:serine/arginine repetitive matrix protein 3-like isoform X2 n=1 Tax=Oncorhynchus keta TaxID=8018 RepID=UPI00227A22FB|nr:serine/arginine repetitive matrix protein 3-like isoform X2 [Oncorhynchus keta]